MILKTCAANLLALTDEVIEEAVRRCRPIYNLSARLERKLKDRAN
jgi:hypothetical protein